VTKAGHSDTTTDGVRVRVAAQYVPDQSDPDRRQFVYAYRVLITNAARSGTVKLLSRHWVIRDANNELREVRDPGVVGEQPELAPGQTFEYMSGCPLRTEWGTMEGSYTMRRGDGTEFQARIGRFFLAPTAAPIASMETGD
jgi:ApaG protein